MPKVLRLHQLGLNVEGWQQTNQLTSTEIKDIPDGAGAKASKLSTSIPTPFARMHLFETAFEFVARERNQNPNTVYHKMVSQFWDLWELLFNHDLYMQADQRLLVRRWNKEKEIAQMQSNPGSKLLGDTLQLFAASDNRFRDYSDLYFFYLENTNAHGERQQQLLGGTSPFTLLFVSPNVRALNIERLQSKGKYFDNQFVPLEERDAAFRDFVYELFTAFSDFPTRYPAVYHMLEQSRLNMIAMNGSSTRESVLNKYGSLRDQEGNPVSAAHFPFLIQSNKGTDTIDSDLFIRPSRQLSERLPIVLKPKLKLVGQTKYLNKFLWEDKTGDEVPYSDARVLDERTLPGKSVRYPYLTINDFLEETLVELPYEVNQERFFCGNVTYQPGAEKNFSYLLPVTSRYFQYFTEKDLADQLTFFIDINHVKVSLKIPVSNGTLIEFERKYYTSPQNPKDASGMEIPEKGKIEKADIGIGIFPFYKLIDQPQYNDFYKVMLIDEELQPGMLTKQYYLKFFVDNQALTPEGGSMRATVTERSVKSEQSVGSKYYEVEGTHFDFAEVTCPGKFNGRGLFVPRYQEIHRGTKSFTFAVDFGTTNTYIAYTDSPNQEPKPFAITAKDLQLVMLNKPSSEPGLTDYQRYVQKGFGKLTSAETLTKREFLPAIMNDGSSPYQFPTRTATCESPGFVNQPTSIFGNINIGFTMNTDADAYEHYHTDLKWSETLHAAGQRRIHAYFRELMLLLKNKAALNGGVIENTKVVWFAPLSFNSFSRNLFQNEWDEAYQKVFKTNRGTICITESVAPYYYLMQKGTVVPSREEGLVNIDIGGGTTDVLLYANQRPAYSFSYRFAGDDLWGDGFAMVRGGKDNGLMQYGRDQIMSMPLSGNQYEYKKYLQSALNNNSFGSSDVVSLMFNYDDVFSYSRMLQQARPMRLMFYLHYGAIIYQLAQTIKASGLNVPRYICFSGRGSLYIKILAAGANLSGIEKLTKAILQKVTGLEAPGNFKIVLVDHPKQTTANGGVLSVNDESSTNQPEIPIITPLGTTDDSTTLKGIKKGTLTSEIKNKVLENVKACIELLLLDDDVAPMMKDLGIEFDAEMVMPFLREQMADSLSIGLNHLDKQLPDQEMLHETLFFLPFKQALYALSKELYSRKAVRETA
ncbi:hypothetical protein I5M27_16805 [Adhaeribacter sp. BT258]|uniref:Uncharacterized protein n=1 Tax=Adhaeribacter terrigena TaxID=2793070 RepID=A0ABS1C5L1_9BACT|nr:hypothetical protein [Adhaeribacter terrigena]MBK0404656.1 hypothetical protein [Adhaeribacter terrigena]